MIENSIINIKRKNTRKAEERKYDCTYFHWELFHRYKSWYMGF